MNVIGNIVINRGAWLVVVSFLALAIAYSARATLGLVMPTLEAELGWSRSFISATAAGALVVMAVLAPVGGRLVDVQGPRNTLAVGLVALSFGCFTIALTESALIFVLAFAGLSAVGFALVATHVASTAVEQLFERSRGLAIGIATSGASAGQFVILPLIAVALATVGWRWSFVMLGFLCLAITACVLWLLPGGPRQRATGAPVNSPAGLAADMGFVVRKPAFHILFWSYLICGYTTTGVIETHFLPYASLCGFGPVPSATAYGLLSAVNMAGMILAGWLTDRVNRPLLLAGIYTVRALSFAVLVNVGAEIETLLFFSVLFGLVDYSTVPVTASLIASHIGLRVMGLTFGLITAGHQIGAALGAYLGGHLFDLYARYDWLWWSSLWLAMVAGLLVLLMRDETAAPEPAPVTE